MNQPRQPHMGRNNAGQFGETTFTKVFVGGLAWETQTETMKRHFEQFGEIQEAVVITDKNTGRSKGYGFVTFKDADAASMACEDPSPTIDGRRANCNLASLGHKAHSSAPQHGAGGFRPVHKSSISAVPAHPSSPYFHQPSQSPWYSVYLRGNMHPLNYYNVYGRNVFPAYYTRAGSEAYHNLPPYYTQYAPSGQGQGSCYGLGMQYFHQYPFVTAASGILPPPPPAAAGIVGSERQSGSLAKTDQHNLAEESNAED